MKRLSPLWLFLPVILCTAGLSMGATFLSNHNCFAGVCGEWLFHTTARQHVAAWYTWLLITAAFFTLRAKCLPVRQFTSTSIGLTIPYIKRTVTRGGLMLATWQCILYSVLIVIWWAPLREYFTTRGEGLPGNIIVALVAQTGHLADVTMGMVLFPVTRNGALAGYFKLEPGTNFLYHMTEAYLLFILVAVHGFLYADWAAIYNSARDRFRPVYPVLEPTYLYHEVWPGNTSALGIWRASLIFTGIVSSLIMFAMLLTSFPVMRRKYFNLFYFTHLFGIAAVVIICLHASTMFYCTAPGLTLWLVDWIIRANELRARADAQLTSMGKGWYKLTAYLPIKRVLKYRKIESPLAHFHIHHSGSSRIEIHPFTSISYLAAQKSVFRKNGKEFIPVEFLFKDTGKQKQSSEKQPKQWTSKLAALADEKDESAAETALLHHDPPLPAPGKLAFQKRPWSQVSSQCSLLDPEEPFHSRHSSATFTPGDVTPYRGSGNWENTLESGGVTAMSRMSTLYQPSRSSLDDSFDNLPAHLAALLESGEPTPGGVELSVRLEGPYFTAAKPSEYETIICLVAGTGVTGAIALASAFHAQKRASRTSLVPSEYSAGEYGSEVALLPKTMTQDKHITFTKSRWSRCVLVWTVRDSEYVELPGISELKCDGLDIQIYRTGGGAPRPDLDNIVRETCGGRGRDCWAYICGPEAYVETAERACKQIEGLTWNTAL